MGGIKKTSVYETNKSSKRWQFGAILHQIRRFAGFGFEAAKFQ